ncbi:MULTISPECIES: hypothetical protein [unclassified Parafrankia]|uniref:hypothetical protein n=1 Tax=Parafrankia TaxID=2994362 RepID=UPI000DA5D2ED|nr:MULTISPECIES: hypothetical protein [unclassified Parafrankia]TCJ34223.1 hypothetical protein E0504_33730 [Parafrankia sp. BMG5.11]SQE00748.1 conserved hypothetical protein [Parafrankia sp. Ea1.12]
MNDSSSDIETRLPDLGTFRLDEVVATANRTLRQVARRLTREASGSNPPLAGFNSSATIFNETGTPGSRIPRTDLRTEEESAEIKQAPTGFSSSIAAAF